MKKRKLVLSSVLKPVDDTRMYEKFGLSLGQTNKYDINIIGFYAKKLPTADNITFHPLFKFKRLNILRLTAPWKCFKKYIKLKPELIIINTHELLIVTSLYKILFGCKIIYDVRENYYRNLLYTDSFPLLLKHLLATYVRAKEYISRSFIDHYFLAEKSYENEFGFSRGKSTVIENKYKPQSAGQAIQKPSHSMGTIRLIFTGTLAETTGVFEAIKVATKLNEYDPAIHLEIVGFCARQNTYDQLVTLIKNKHFIHLQGGLKHVPHPDILRAIKHADFGIIYYPENRSTMNSMPTKLFEYIGNCLPVLIQNHQPWVEFCNRYNAAVPIDTDQLEPGEILQEMLKKKSTTIKPGKEIFWASEEEKLLNNIDNMI